MASCCQPSQQGCAIKARAGAVLCPAGLLIMVRKTTNDGLLLWAPFLAFSWSVSKQDMLRLEHRPAAALVVCIASTWVSRP